MVPDNACEMKKIKFTEVLNDAISYFLLGDIIALKNYKTAKNLPDDLATEFTANESGDNVVKDGILIPLAEVDNCPYTIIFNLSDETPELLKDGNEPQVRQDGYILKVESNKIMLFTWWILNNFVDESIRERIESQAKYNKPQVELENGWYKIEVLGGLTRQESEIINRQGEIVKIVEYEPTYEFIIKKTEEKKACTADIFHSYKLKTK